MPKFKSKEIIISMDMAGCPNRCKHCWLGHAPNRKVDKKLLKEVVDTFKNWVKAGDTEPYFDKVNVNSWYREPDFSDDYKELYELEKELGDKVVRFELLSIWRAARDLDYVKWAKEIGTKKCQITFFGMEENTDYFTGRKWAFKDNLIATERLLDAGIVPRWQVFLNDKSKYDLNELVKLVSELNLEERVAKLGGEFEIFTHIPSPDGKSFELEDIRPKKGIDKFIPEYIKEKSKKHFRVEDFSDILGKPEKELLTELLKRDEPYNNYPPLAFMITPDLDVYSNIGEPMAWWCLGNIEKDGIDKVMNRFINNEVIGLNANFEVSVSHLAKEYGRRESDYLYTEDDLIIRWLRLWGEDRKDEIIG